MSNKVKPSLIRRLKIYWKYNWLKISIIFGIVILVYLSYIGLMSMEPFYRRMTLAQIPMTLILTALNAVIFVFFYSTFFKTQGFGNMKKNKVKSDKVNVTFKDIIGMEETKKEAMEVVNLMKDRLKVKKIGGKIIKGLLMVGPPGCGKTYIAKAIATEAGVPFLSVAGSEFVEVFVGVGASRVRKLFNQARELAYSEGCCIVFIDELDVIGKSRSFSYLGGGGETNSTLNQLLVEMDGLGDNLQNVIVIGATNASEDVLDQALLRPGRFDRKIIVTKPNLEERKMLFEYYLSKVKKSDDIDIGRLARRCVYKSPAEISNIVKESALIAMRNEHEKVEYKDISQAIERVDLGIAHKLNQTDKEKEMTAYHETGHLVTLYLLHPTKDVFKASILSRGGALGVVYPQPKAEYYSFTRETFYADIKVALAGYVAEKIKYNTTTSGVSADFKNAINVAYMMVWTIGMGKSGMIGDYTSINEKFISEEIRNKLNSEVNEIMQECLKDVEDLLKSEWTIVEEFVKELMEKNELDYDEIDAVFAKYGKSNSRFEI